MYPTSRRDSIALAFGLAANLAVFVVAQTRTTAQAPAQTPQPSTLDPVTPVNLYAANANPYPPPQNGELRAQRVAGHVWLVTGQPGESNVLVNVGEQGVLVVDTGTQPMASKLLAQVQRLAQEQSSSPNHQTIRKVINTNGRIDHIGGNEILRKAGGQVIGGEEAAQQRAFGTAGAEVVAHENVLMQLVIDSAAPGAPPQELWPTDTEGFDVDNTRFNGEAVQIVHPRSGN